MHRRCIGVVLSGLEGRRVWFKEDFNGIIGRWRRSTSAVRRRHSVKAALFRAFAANRSAENADERLTDRDASRFGPLSTAMLQADSQPVDASARAGETAIVDIQHVSRSYGSVRALRDVNLTLMPGTIGLVGNNGAGKSTLLKVLLGLLAPDEGGGTILGCDIRHGSPTLRGRVGYMPEAAAIVPMLKGVEFVAFAGDLYGMPRRDARRRAHEVLNYVGLGELRYRRLEEYSTGNLQRLKLAAALVHDPQLLLLDEPTNGLDPAVGSPCLSCSKI